MDIKVLSWLPLNVPVQLVAINRESLGEVFKYTMQHKNRRRKRRPVEAQTVGVRILEWLYQKQAAAGSHVFCLRFNNLQSYDIVDSLQLRMKLRLMVRLSTLN